MNKKIFVINGSGGVGKDLFVKLVSNYVPTINFSSVDKIKEIAKIIGWDGISKTDKDRKFLSDLKQLTNNYNDMPFQSMKHVVGEFYKDNTHQCLFLHIREPEEIKRAVKEFNAKTILITRKSVEHITSNSSDAMVYNYNYNYTISNNGSIKTLEHIVEYFVREVVLGGKYE